MAGGVVDFEGQLIDRKLVTSRPCVRDDIGCQGQQLAALRIGRVHIDLAAGCFFEGCHRPYMVVVAVGQQDMAQRCARLLQRLLIGGRLGRGVDQDAVLGVRDN